jgi:hypothetical protein
VVRHLVYVTATDSTNNGNLHSHAAADFFMAFVTMALMIDM